jgi:hypothetical protein
MAIRKSPRRLKNNGFHYLFFPFLSSQDKKRILSNITLSLSVKKPFFSKEAPLPTF